MDAGTVFDGGSSGHDAGSPPFDAGGSTDNGGEGDRCTCSGTDSSQDQTLGKACSGTEDGCEGFGGSGQLRCLMQVQSGIGICEYFCSASEAGMRGSCPGGYTCGASHLVDVTGDNWSICIRN